VYVGFGSALTADAAVLLKNSRKTEHGAGKFLISFGCAPHPLRFCYALSGVQGNYL
jgi:hypothetical protein